ncbi:DegT/DnrJ/EryC1/StrS family aminotransferase [bacterium]|nr:DegT/DnrJ/EryC1/StrS family aminotransferase [bacterium]
MSEPIIPIFDAARQYAAIREEIDAAVAECLAGGRYILGERLEHFEAAFAKFAEARHAIGVANGTDAIRLALEACGVRRGADVLTVPNTAIPTAMAIADMGCCPIFVDVDERSWNMNAELLGSAVTDRTEAIVPVHLYGRPADMPAIMAIADARDLTVVEDCAQAHGARIANKPAGGFGRASAFSFYPSKNLGAAGDAGAVTTRDDVVARDVRYLRNYGQTSRYEAAVPGINSRLDEIQAAILSVKLRHLGAWNAKRREIAARYDAAFAELPLRRPADPDGATSVYHLYVVATPERDRLAEHLRTHAIGTQVHYPIPIHRQPAFAELGYRYGAFPVAERLSREILSLPLFPEMTDGEIERVIAGVRSFFG